MIEPCDTKSLVVCKSCLESKEPEFHNSPSKANDALNGYGSSVFIYSYNLFCAVESCESKMSTQLSCSVSFSDWVENKTKKPLIFFRKNIF
jgi:predicted metal-binding protein